MKHYKVVCDTSIERYFVYSKVPNGAWLQVSKPYKRKRDACIRMNMLCFNIPYQLAVSVYEDEQEHLVADTDCHETFSSMLMITSTKGE